MYIYEIKTNSMTEAANERRFNLHFLATKELENCGRHLL